MDEIVAFRKLSKIGTGTAVFIPSFFMKELGLRDQQIVTLILDKSSQSIIIKKLGGDVNGDGK